MKEKNNYYKNISKLDFKEENISKYISEKNYEEDMLNILEPYLKDNMESGTILGINNISLYYEKFVVANSKGNIVICHGFGEFIDKYYELTYYFLKEGYSVFIMEHRGNGRSNRLGSDKNQISVEKFNYYVEDFKQFLDEVVIQSGNNKDLLLFAHSMGGGIGTVFIEKYPKYFKGVVLSSPMHGINTGKSPKIFAYILCRIMNIIGMGKKYLPGQVPYSNERKFPNRTTSCENRYNYEYKKIKNNKLYQTGGASAKWYLECLVAIKNSLKKKNASKVNVPILLLQAEYDTHVMPKAHYKFAKYAKNCKVMYVKGAKHETYFECDSISFVVVENIISFYNKIVD